MREHGVPADLDALRDRRDHPDLQQSPQQWGGFLGDDVLATAILDRLLHHCDVLAINGSSWRLSLVTKGEPMP
jgi:DNA replication protein DnaC